MLLDNQLGAARALRGLRLRAPDRSHACASLAPRDRYGEEERRSVAEVAGDPRNRPRWALGNGALAASPAEDFERLRRDFAAAEREPLLYL